MRIIATVLTGGLLAGSLISAPHAAALTPQAPAAQDACYDYRAKAGEEGAATATPVACETQHTAQTFFVGAAPDSLGVPAKANAKAKLRLTRGCTIEAMDAYLGLTNASIPSRFQVVTVFPTRAQWNAGERWVRCDVVLRGGKDYTRFAGTAQNLVATTPREQFNFCTPSVPGSRTKAAYPCNKPKKNWIMVAERDLGKIGSNFPGTRSVERKAKRICERIGNTYTERKKFFPWWAIWPTRTGWSQGDRTAQCFVPYAEYLKTTQPTA